MKQWYVLYVSLYSYSRNWEKRSRWNWLSDPHPTTSIQYAMWRLPGTTKCPSREIWVYSYSITPLLWRHNVRDNVSNDQPHDCLLNRSFGHRSKKTPKLRVTGLCAGNSPETGEFPAQRASNAENVSIWWHHHDQPVSPQQCCRVACQISELYHNCNVKSRGFENRK